MRIPRFVVSACFFAALIALASRTSALDPRVPEDGGRDRRGPTLSRSQANRILTSMSELDLNSGSASSCVSRTEQHKYWKKTFRNSRLHKILDDYEIFHRACRDKEGDLNDLLMNEKPLPCKYFFYKANYNGMGNKLLALVSAYLFSVLTNRVFLVDEAFPFKDYFCSPFNHSSIVPPSNFITDLLFWKSLDMEDFRKKVEQENGVKEMMKNPPYCVTLNLCEESHPEAFCSIYIKMYEKIPVLMFRSNQYFVTPLYRTIYRRKLEELFPDNVVFPHLARRLLNPSNEIWAKIKSFYDEKLASADTRFGMQIRPWERAFRLDKVFFALQCARTNHFLPKIPDPENKFSPESLFKPSKTIACLISSLEIKFYDHIYSEYDQAIGQGDELVTVYKFGNSTEEHNKNMDHNKEAISDMWLLSFCENLVISSGSTFGYVASSLAGIKPYFFNKLDPWHFVTLEEDCTAGDSIEPCFHFPADNYTCPDGQYFEKPWSGNSLLKQCRDFPRGAQAIVSGKSASRY